MKAINYKMKNLNRFVHSSKGSPWDLQLSRICLTSTKRTSNMTKIKNSFTFFCEKQCGSQSGHIEFIKNIRFVTPIPFETFLWKVFCDLLLMKLGNNQTKKKAKLCNTCFYRKEFISKDMKAINYKMKKFNGFVYISKGSPWELQLSRICLTSTKRTWNMTKIKN